MSGTYYEYNFKKEPDDSLRCLICLEVAVNPVQHICGRLFCKECIEQCGDDPCPNCREESPEYFPDTRGRRDIEGLAVSCSNVKKGCKWVGPLGELDDHVTEKCDYSEVFCPNGCHENVRRKNLSSHLKKCSKREYSCKRCGEWMIYENKDEHSLVCRKKSIKCRNVGCSVTVEREKMSEHEENCKYAETVCIYEYIGCTQTRRRKDMKPHEEDHKFHLQLALEELQVCQQNLHHREDELRAVRERASNFERQLELAQAEITRLKVVNRPRPTSNVIQQNTQSSTIERRDQHPPKQQTSSSDKSNCVIS